MPRDFNSCADHTRFVGVAPEANLLSFKVFTNDGYSNEETVIEGFLKAFESGVSDDPVLSSSNQLAGLGKTKF